MVSLIRYAKFDQTNHNRPDVATGKTHTSAKGRFWQIRLEPKSGRIIDSQRFIDLACEFPTVALAEVGKQSRFTYL